MALTLTDRKIAALLWVIHHHDDGIIYREEDIFKLLRALGYYPESYIDTLTADEIQKANKLWKRLK